MIVSPACTHSPSWRLQFHHHGVQGGDDPAPLHVGRRRIQFGLAHPGLQFGHVHVLYRLFDGKRPSCACSSRCSRTVVCCTVPGILPLASRPASQSAWATVGRGLAVADVDVVGGLFFGRLQLVHGDVLLRPRHDVVDLGQQIALGNLLTVVRRESSSARRPLAPAPATSSASEIRQSGSTTRIGRPDDATTGETTTGSRQRQQDIAWSSSCKAQK